MLAFPYAPFCGQLLILFVHRQKQAHLKSDTPHLPDVVLRSESTVSEIDLDDIVSIQSVTPDPEHP